MSIQHTPRCIQLMATRDAMIALWVDAIRREIPYARNIAEPALVNALPVFYEYLSATMCGEDGDFDYSTIAAEHGDQRARVTRYNAGSIVHEFQLFRAALFTTWHDAGVTLALDEVAWLTKAIDEALRVSLTGFSLSEARIREQFFSALTHDLRTPLSTAKTAVDIIHNTTDLTRAHRFAEMAQRQHAMLETMITDLLDMMVSTAGGALPKLENANLNAITADAIAGIALTSNRCIELQGEQVDGKWQAAELRRAIENLLNNAVKYSDNDTTIDVTVRAEGNRAIVAVSNTGPTIPPEQIDVIFQLFRRSARAEDRGITGWGIGLPYVRSVAERHGGNIAVESSDELTTFVLTVPLDPAPLLTPGP
jgi:signal transduction histidine kinase